MLRTNSKQARENVRNYILENFIPDNYEPDFWQNIEKYRKNSFYELDKFSCAAHFIYGCFISEKWSMREDHLYYNNSERAAFGDWCAGLPSVLGTCYYYNRSAVDDLGAILEQTENEKNKYSESEAEYLLTTLIYREIKNAVEK